jgi:serine/threonine-protein kinase
VVRDRRTGQTLGLKVLDRKKTAAFEARFKGLGKPCEGEIAIRFKHPNIVVTYEHGVTTDGSAYLLMEYLQGPGINSLIAAKEHRLDGRRVSFIRQAGEALVAVHRAGFLHRDVSPRNLMLAGEGETVKLIDFGLSVPAKEPFFQPGNRTGNPNYMAPELVRRRRTDFRVDVFAFGVTGYEICTLELPWQAGLTGQVAMSHEKPPTDIRRFRPQIHPALAQAIHWCVEPDVKKRCPSIAEFLTAIAEVDHEDQPGGSSG